MAIVLIVLEENVRRHFSLHIILGGTNIVLHFPLNFNKFEINWKYFCKKIYTYTILRLMFLLCLSPLIYGSFIGYIFFFLTKIWGLLGNNIFQVYHNLKLCLNISLLTKIIHLENEIDCHILLLGLTSAIVAVRNGTLVKNTFGMYNIPRRIFFSFYLSSFSRFVIYCFIYSRKLLLFVRGLLEN